MPNPNRAAVRGALRPAALVTLLILPALALAQAGATAKDDAAEKEKAAAMERAQRMAANPMRVILQAGRINRRPGAEGAPEPETPAPRRAGASRAVEIPGVAPTLVSTLPATAALVTGAVSPAPAAAPATLSPASTAAAPAAVQSPLAALGADALPAPVPAAAPALEPARSSVVAPAVALPAAAAPRAELVQALDRPTLVNMVEPIFNPAAADEAARLREVEAEIDLRADGSVAAVRVVSRVPRTLLRPITEALQQWRYAPLRAERTIRVTLAFS